MDAARRLGQRVDAILLLLGGEEVDPLRTNEVPVFHGAAVKAVGHLGAFELQVKDFAVMTPSAKHNGCQFARLHRSHALPGDSPSSQVPFTGALRHSWLSWD